MDQFQQRPNIEFYIHRSISKRIPALYYETSLYHNNYETPGCTTSIERKSRMPHIHGIKGEAVVVYCESLITKEMEYHRLSRRVNKMMK
jgi:hypothetical protein